MFLYRLGLPVQRGHLIKNVRFLHRRPGSSTTTTTMNGIFVKRPSFRDCAYRHHYHLLSSDNNNNNGRSQFFTTTTTTTNKKASSPNNKHHGDHLLQWLKKEGCLDMKHERPIKIRAEPWMIPHDESNNTHKNNNKDASTTGTITTKILHFQRHGQGYHNLIYTLLDEKGYAPSSVYDTDPTSNPFVRSELVDAPLTEHGRLQCIEKHQQLLLHSNHDGSTNNLPTRRTRAIINPELIVVSPLTRCIQTSLLTFQHLRQPHVHVPENEENEYQGVVPFLAHEDLREEMGLLLCNKRRSISELALDFPTIDFSLYNNPPNNNNNNNNHDWKNEDTLFCPTTRESAVHQSERIYRFLVDFIAQRSEHEIGIVGHSAWLFHMCHGVMECHDEDNNNQNDQSTTPTKLTSWFEQADLRSMKVTFTTTPR